MAHKSFRVAVCFFHSKIPKLSEKVFQQRSQSLSHVHKNISWFYNKSISRGNTSDFIAKVENVFVC